MTGPGRRALVVGALFCVWMFSPLPARGTDGAVLATGIVHSIHSDVLGEERELWLRLPAGYDVDPGRFPVLYLLDGSYHFPHVAATADFLADRGLAPGMIVVGIASDEWNRGRDLTPSAVDAVEGSGGAGRFLRFIREELIPFVEGRYRASDLRILAGHSHGGLFTVYAWLEAPDLFDACLALAPSLYWDDRLLLRSASRGLADASVARGYLYVGTGSGDREAIRSASEAFGALLEDHAPAGTRWKLEIRGGENHDSVQMAGFYAALSGLFADWRVPFDEDGSNWNLAAVEDHYGGLSRRLGCRFAVPEYALNGLGFRLFALRDTANAIATFERNVAQHPHSADALFQLGSARARTGDRSGALEAMEAACTLGERNQDPRRARYRRALDDMREASSGR